MKELYLTLMASCLLFSTHALGQVEWEGDLDNNWFTENLGDTNWIGNVLPSLPDDVVIALGNVELTSNSATINALDISGNLPANTPFLNMFSEASLVVTTDALVGGAAGMTGQLDVTTSASGNQTVFQSSTLTVGRGAGSNGTVNVNGAEVSVSGDLHVGDDGGTGSFFASTGGNATRSDVSANRVYVGRDESSTGIFALAHTDFQTGGAVVGFGSNSSGTMSMDHVVATTGNFNAGFSALSVGSLSTTQTEWTLNGFLRIGTDGSGDVTLDIGSQVEVNTTGTSPSVMIGQNAGSDGYLEVSAFGDGGSTLTTNQQITVGYSGNGELNITGNAVVKSGPGTSPTNSAMIIANLEGEGILNISEQGRYEAATGSDVIVGFVGNATATIESDGVLKARDMQVARHASSTSNVYVAGGNGRGLIELERALYIGGSDTAQGGQATVEVIEDSQILVGEKIQLWKSDSTLSLLSDNPAFFGGAVGVGIVDQALLSSGVLSVFQDGVLQGAGTLEGSLTVHSGGVVAPGNSAGILTVTETTKLEEGSILDIEIGGQLVGTEFDQLATDVFESDGGTIRITLIGLFVPSVGNTFQIVNTGMLDLTEIFFDFTNASLDPGLSWDTDLFEINGSISVVPEPSVACLLGLGGLLLLRRQRR